MDFYAGLGFPLCAHINSAQVVALNLLFFFFFNHSLLFHLLLPSPPFAFLLPLFLSLLPSKQTRTPIYQHALASYYRPPGLQGSVLRLGQDWISLLRRQVRLLLPWVRSRRVPSLRRGNLPSALYSAITCVHGHLHIFHLFATSDETPPLFGYLPIGLCVLLCLVQVSRTKTGPFTKTLERGIFLTLHNVTKKTSGLPFNKNKLTFFLSRF